MSENEGCGFVYIVILDGVREQACCCFAEDYSCKLILETVNNAQGEHMGPKKQVYFCLTIAISQQVHKSLLNPFPAGGLRRRRPVDLSAVDRYC